MTMNSNACTRTCTIITRTVAVVYSVSALFTFLEARDLAQSDGYQYDEERGIVFVPLLLCAPPSVQADGSSLLISSDSNCRDMNYLISAPFVCSACSAVACVFFVVMDVLARFKKGPMSMSAVMGMGLYLVIILVQAGFSTFALVEQNLYWVNYMQDYLDREGFDAKAMSYASTQILLGSAGCAFLAAFLILVDGIVYRCNERNRAKLEAKQIDDFLKAAKEHSTKQQSTKQSNVDNNTDIHIQPSKTVDTVENEDTHGTDDGDCPSWMV